MSTTPKPTTNSNVNNSAQKKAEEKLRLEKEAEAKRIAEEKAKEAERIRIEEIQKEKQHQLKLTNTNIQHVKLKNQPLYKVTTNYIESFKPSDLVAVAENQEASFEIKADKVKPFTLSEVKVIVTSESKSKQSTHSYPTYTLGTQAEFLKQEVVLRINDSDFTLADNVIKLDKKSYESLKSTPSRITINGHQIQNDLASFKVIDSVDGPLLKVKISNTDYSIPLEREGSFSIGTLAATSVAVLGVGGAVTRKKLKKNS